MTLRGVRGCPGQADQMKERAGGGGVISDASGAGSRTVLQSSGGRTEPSPGGFG